MYLYLVGLGVFNPLIFLDFLFVSSCSNLIMLSLVFFKYILCSSLSLLLLTFVALEAVGSHNIPQQNKWYVVLILYNTYAVGIHWDFPGFWKIIREIPS